ncbi:type IX secretion system sortase PorU [Flavobacterium sp. CS20]|uniref:type IX secretion system sortase PorU n=1 Tax=Flavobacterium sp. CS20 TaxID=2775246 RepID=UPI001B3A5D93|nr:type IX secretion system sortase PorU [Flavobacterium sp. CS20]QTY28030.1 type IX secretion system sortase PorU [Flavobacterium sp. CS20]
MKFKYLLIFFFSSTSLLLAQNKSFTINWSQKKNISTQQDKTILVSAFDDKYFSYDYREKKIIYSRTLTGLPNANYQLSDLQFETVDSRSLDRVEAFQKEFAYDLNLSKARGQNTITISFNPYLKENGVVKRLVSYQLDISQNRTISSIASNIESNSINVQNSILEQGNWFKFYVDKTGVYKLSHNFLSQLGLDLNNASSDAIKIYSHGGAMLPLLNSENEYYDPPQLPIQVFDGGDGRFDSGDFILMYAESTQVWNEESQTHINAYADKAYYYVTLNNETPNRVQPQQSLSGNPDEIINEFDEFQFHEVDETSLSLVGRRWFGDRFDIETEKEFGFEFKNLITSKPLRYDIKFGAISEVQSSFSISINGNEVNTINISPVGDDLPSNGNDIISQTNVNSDSVTVKLTYNKNGNPATRGFLDYIRLRAKRELRADNEQFQFQNLEISPNANVIQYNLVNASNISQVWKINGLTDISTYQNTDANENFSYVTSHDQNSKFIAISPDDYFQPLIDESNKIVNNQNLKGTIFDDNQGNFQDVDYIIIARNDFLSHANRLANFRRNQNGLNVKVVDLQSIYTEFSSGKPDIVAIRNFLKYVYDNASSQENRLKYLCLIGDASVDYKNRLQGNNNILPTFQSYNSFATTVSSFMSDDFYTMMDANEGDMNSANKMDFAVGRIVVDTQQQAREAIDKIMDYETRPSYDNWRNNFILVSDDVDQNWEYATIEVNLDNLGDEISENKPNINVKKIHSDAFQQQSSAGGDRYPKVNLAISDQVEVGATVLNYFGHGGEDGLAQERIVTQSNVESWQNPNRYNVFLTVTCEFTRFDNPLRITAGELSYRNPQGGPVSMISTTRAISVSDGVSFNRELAPFLFDYDENRISVGEAVRLAKNILGTNGRRIVFYIGDPALHIPFPKPNVRLTHINDTPLNQFTDTLKALSQNKFSGEIVDDGGNIISNYNGVVSTTLFDKRIQRSTLANDNTTNSQGELLIMDFTTLGEVLFSGQASVNNGKFDIEFVLPKDTQIPVGNGRVSFYALRNNVLEDQSGYSNDILIGDINENAPEDNQGPQIQLFMNDESFVDGEITDNAPFLISKLQDENGINTAGGIGHDIIAYLDGDESNPMVLNEFYKADVDDFTSGEVVYKLRDLEDGSHTLSFKAWDVYNNSSTADIQFRVASSDGLDITRVLNYPNPFVNYTEFWFHHNQPFVPLNVQVQVFTVTGKVVWTHNETITTDSFLAREITWDGRDDFGDQIGKGVYVYKLTVESPNINKKVEKFEKLVKL